MPLSQNLPQATPPDAKIQLVPGPVNNKGFPVDRFKIYESPESAVKAFITVVSHDKQRVFGDGNRSKIIPWLVVSGNNVRVGVNAKIMVDEFVIHVQLFVATLNDVTANADNPLDKIFLGIHRVFEHDDIAALGRFKGNDGFIPVGNFNAENKFVDQNVIADLQGLLHGTGRYFKGLNHECAYEQGNQNCHQDGFDILSNMTSFGGLFRFYGSSVFFQVLSDLSLISI